MSSSSFEELVSDLDYPMFIVTVAADGHRAGCLVGFASQASIDPQRLLVMVSKTNHTYKVVQHASVLVVHFLSAANRDLATLFGETSGDDQDKFNLCAWQPGPEGTPVLNDVRGWVAGRIVGRLDCGDHVAHLLETIEAHHTNSGSPLTFQAVSDMDPGHDA